MYCPVCKNKGLVKLEVEPGLVGFKCDCEGIWIRANDYHAWKNKDKGEEQRELMNYEYKPEYDSKKANLCPDCRRILIKYRVAKHIPFFVDHCGSCNGVWLDKDEWYVLVNGNLHENMNEFFTVPWQNKLREELSKDNLEEHYLNMFGKEKYAKLKEIRSWVYDNDQKEYLLNYLMDEDPYKI